LIIRGANGETSIKLYNSMRFLLPNAIPGEQNPSGNTQDGVRELKVRRRNPPCPPAAIADPFSFTPVSTAAPATSSAAQVTLFVETPSEKQQRMVWGLTRTLIANAIVGQSDGYTLPIYLIGVGYRAVLEVDQASAAAFASNTHPSKSTATATTPATSTLPASTVVATPVGSTTTHEMYPRRRLVMRLGYSHVIYVPVPSDLRVTVQSPTIILVWGRDKQRVGQFCADVRALRKPEVYKGKVCTHCIRGSQ
jgi:ribosomal protein L6P/L9E